MVHLTNASYPKPEHIGIPVTTLVGFYDPEGKIQGKMYPPMYGSWGNVFDFAKNQSKCLITVHKTDGNTLYFPLDDTRLNAKTMNKFHINLDSSAHYQDAVLTCDTSKGPYTLKLNLQRTAPPALPKITIVGGKEPYASAALQLKTLGTYCSNGTLQAFNSDDFVNKLDNIYGPWNNYFRGDVVQKGLLYTTDHNHYYQARVSGKVPSPTTNDVKNWRYLGAETACIKNISVPTMKFHIQGGVSPKINANISKLKSLINAPGSEQRLAFVVNQKAQETKGSA